MKLTKEHVSSFLFILLEMLIGALLLFRPVGFTTWIIIGVGVLLLLKAVQSIIAYVRSSPLEAAKSQSLTKGLLLLLLGGFCVFRSGWFVATFPAITVIYGVGMLAGSLSKVQATMDALRAKNPKWFLYAISAVVSAVCAIVIICNPFSTTAVLWVFAGISLIVEALLDAVSFILGSVASRK